ncbi:MAG: hypothetical protein AAB223_00895, partial [Pseudomonadota bacterium]
MNPAENAAKNAERIRAAVRSSYARVAEKGGNSGCCAPAASTPKNMSARFGYSAEEIGAVPEGADL